MSRMLWVHLALLFVTLLYGANYTIAKYALPEYLKPLAFISVRLLSGTILFWAIDSLQPREAISRKDHWLLFRCGLFGAALNQLLFFEGLSRTTPIHGSIMMTMSPIAVILIASLLGREFLTRRKVIGTIVGFTGAVLLLTRHGISLDEGTFTGDLLILLNGTSYAIYLILVKPLTHRYRPFTVLKWLFLYGTLIAVPFGIPQLAEVSWSTLPLSAWLSVAYVVFATTFTVYLLNAWALQYVNSSIVGIYIYLQPVFATIVALSLGQDHLEIQTVLFASIIMMGVYLVSKQKR
ncbi:DMT family transporter [Fulvivirga sedimenti]|uniref:DMT family transporter n=1 Tax=Fulvivirga sedimenti TaxID=2879465 RepID=A0A9X1HL65_9BACT|nr:DMT family transporter [Fulvivirga sedimenti]MCA6074289.1 DMT family transporter [Fulvivirga sedimenti]